MKSKILALAVVLVLVISGIIMFVPSSDVTWDTLKENDATAYERAKAVSSNENVTIEDAANFTLYKCGLSDAIAGKTQFDRRSMISYSGILNNISKGYSDNVKNSDLNLMLSNAADLKNAYSDKVPYFNNGLAVPIFGFTEFNPPDYSNANSDIIRYWVYVETDYDTDSDGKRDLVKVFLQVPRSAVVGNYKAPVILECNPYAMGTIPDDKIDVTAADSYDLSKLYSQPTARKASGSVDPMTLALSATSDDWKFEKRAYDALFNYDYYLVRGYAVALCCGPGSYGSEGFACTGTDIELSAYKKVVEWFDGKATAFSDTKGCVTTKAEWSSGYVGTYGISYLGTIQVGLATMGLPNLKTVVPLGAITDWYSYSYCQGGSLDVTPYNYTLTGYVSSRYIVSGFTQEYRDYLSKLKYEEELMKGNYVTGVSKFWYSRDYRNMDLHPGTSILLIEGLNENNVRTKQFDMAYDMFTEAGYSVKAILHQGLHQGLNGTQDYPDLSEKVATMKVGDQLFYDIMNRWYSHYLFGIDNGAEDLENIWIQSNIDGSWTYREDLDPESSVSFTSSASGTNTITRSGYDADPVFKTVSDSGRSAVTFNITDDTTLFGVPKVTVRASTSNVVNDAQMTVALYDVCEGGMTTCLNLNKKSDSNMVVSTGEVMWMGSGLENYDIARFYESNKTYQLITASIVDMNNPSSNYEPKTAVKETITANTYYEYNLYLNPTSYTIEKGHTLAVVVYTFDPNNLSYSKMTSDTYSLTIDESSIKVYLDIV